MDLMDRNGPEWTERDWSRSPGWMTELIEASTENLEVDVVVLFD